MVKRTRQPEDQWTSQADTVFITSAGVVMNETEFLGDDIETWQVFGLGGSDVFQVFSISVAIDGGAGSDTLIAPNTTNDWTIDASNAGHLNSSVTFASIENLAGGRWPTSSTSLGPAAYPGKSAVVTGQMCSTMTSRPARL